MNFSVSTKYFQQYGLLLSWLILVLFDILFRGTLWLQNNLYGIRFIENYVISSLALLSLLYLLSLIKQKWIISLLFLLTTTFPLIINGSYFLVYKKFISKATFILFFESPQMVSSTALDNTNIPFFKPIRRLICSSKYMPTFHNNPNCAIIDTNMQSIFVFFSKNSVTDKRNNTYYPYSKLDLFYKEELEKRISRKKPIPMIR
jgi:hypothetical protein